MTQKASSQSCTTLAFSLKRSTPVLMIQVSYAVSFPAVNFTALLTSHRHRALPRRRRSSYGRLVCRKLRPKSITFNYEHPHSKQPNPNSSTESLCVAILYSFRSFTGFPSLRGYNTPSDIDQVYHKPGKPRAHIRSSKTPPRSYQETDSTN